MQYLLNHVEFLHYFTELQRFLTRMLFLQMNYTAFTMDNLYCNRIKYTDEYIAGAYENEPVNYKAVKKTLLVKTL